MRHFRLNRASRCSEVRRISLPAGDEDASKFIQEAVRAYPELYFARYVILGEGATEEVVLPMLAKAMDFPIDRSFVAVVPLGGRHVNHLWRLLFDLQVPFATLLDLDWGRSGGGFGRIKTVLAQLLSVGYTGADLFADQLRPEGPQANLDHVAALNPADIAHLHRCVLWLERFNVYYSDPLDLDYTMLNTYPAAYRRLEPGMRGPSMSGDPRGTVLGDDGRPDFYDAAHDDALRWYRYLFLGRGKPSTHVRVLSRLTQAELLAGMPQPLGRMLQRVREAIEGAAAR